MPPARDRSKLMISYSVTLYQVVGYQRAATFCSTCETGGLFHSLVKELPGHLGTIVFVESDTSELLLVLQLWSSRAAGNAAETSPMGELLLKMLARLAKRSCHLGIYSPCPDDSPNGESESSLSDRLFDDWRAGQPQPNGKRDLHGVCRDNFPRDLDVQDWPRV